MKPCCSVIILLLVVVSFLCLLDNVSSSHVYYKANELHDEDDQYSMDYPIYLISKYERTGDIYFVTGASVSSIYSLNLNGTVDLIGRAHARVYAIDVNQTSGEIYLGYEGTVRRLVDINTMEIVAGYQKSIADDPPNSPVIATSHCFGVVEDILILDSELFILNPTTVFKVSNGMLSTFIKRGSIGYSLKGICRSSSTGDFYVTDISGAQLTRFTPSTGQIVVVAGQKGKMESKGDGGLAIDSSLNWPFDCVVTDNNEIFISETDGRIRKIMVNNTISTVYKGANFQDTYLPRDGTIFFSSGSTISTNLFNGTIVTLLDVSKSPYQKPSSLGPFLLSNNTIVALDTPRNAMYGFSILDGSRTLNPYKYFSTANRHYWVTGEFLYICSGWLISKYSMTKNDNIAAIYVNPYYAKNIVVSSLSDDIYFVGNENYGTQTIFRIEKGKGDPFLFAGSKTEYAYKGENGTLASSALFSGISKLFIAAVIQPDGSVVDELYIVSDNRIRLIRNNTISTIVGTGENVFNGDNIPAINSNLDYIHQLYVTHYGVIYICERTRIRKVENGIISTIAGNGDSSFVIQENGFATSITPSALVVDERDNIVYVSNKGKLIKLTGSCEAGYFGSNCDIYTCFGLVYNTSKVCSGMGQCLSPDSCHCTDNYFGGDCNITMCFSTLQNDSRVCSGNGECISLNQCNCKPGWYGQTCSMPSCFGYIANDSMVCGGKGSCHDKDSCSCKSGFYGNECQNWECYGKKNTNFDVCNRNGICTSLNTCFCESGWFGNECSIPICGGILGNSSKVCNNGNGTCSKPWHCECNAGYSGDDCSIPICFGILGNDTNVCSGTGFCSAKDTCSPFPPKHLAYEISTIISGMKPLERSGNGINALYFDEISQELYFSDSTKVFVLNISSGLFSHYAGSMLSPNYKRKTGRIAIFTSFSDIYFLSKIGTNMLVQDSIGSCIIDQSTQKVQSFGPSILTLGGGSFVYRIFVSPYSGGVYFLSSTSPSFIFKQDGAGYNLIAGKNNWMGGTFKEDSNPEETIIYASRLCFSKDGSIYFTEYGTYRFRKLDSLTGKVKTVAGTGVKGVGLDGINATQSEINSPFNCYVSPSDEVYFTDGNRLRKIYSNGTITTVHTSSSGMVGDFVVTLGGAIYFVSSTSSITKIIPHLEVTIEGFISSNNPNPSSNRNFQSLSKFGNNKVLLSSGEGRIKIHHLNNGSISTEESFASMLSGYFVSVLSIANIDNQKLIIASNSLDLCDIKSQSKIPLINEQFIFIAHSTFTGRAYGILQRYGSKIVKLSPDWSSYSDFSGGEKSEYVDSVPVTDARYQAVRCLFIWNGNNSTEEIYVCDQCSIRKIKDGLVSTVVGGYDTKNCTITPYSIFVTSTETIYFSDVQNHLIYKMEKNGIPIVIAGSYEMGFNGEFNQPALQALLNTPTYLLVDEQNKAVYFLDGSQRVRKLEQSICEEGWVGDCTIATCDGIIANEPNVCNGKGSCIAPNMCHCVEGYLGSKCDEFKCFGTNFNDTNVCSSNGICESPNVCKCKSGYHGGTCESFKCFNFWNNDTNVCTGKGVCSDIDSCTCPNRWFGRECSITQCFGILSNVSKTCSRNGDCIAFDECKCKTGWVGKSCSIPLCFGISANDSQVCSQQGQCIDTDTCSCNTGYNGLQCYEYSCFGVPNNSSTVCSSNGNCVHTDVCQCNDGWSGDLCNKPVCGGVSSDNPQVCSSKGQCVAPNSCECIDGYLGSKCDEFKCFGANFNDTDVCSRNGNCTAFDECKCKTGWVGKSCSIPLCFGISANDSQVCSQQGQCLAPNICNCNTGFSGLECNTTISICFEIPSILASVCSGHGSCVGFNNCSCQENYTGSSCNFHMCYGVAYNLPTTCSGNGPCVNVNECKCKTNFYGNDCRFTNNSSISNGTTKSNTTIETNTTSVDNSTIDRNTTVQNNETNLLNSTFKVQILSPNNPNLLFVNPNEDFILKSVIEPQTNMMYSYKWLTPMSDIEITKSYLIIPKKFLTSGYSFSITLEILTEDHKKTTTVINAKVNEPPTMGDFSVSSTTGYILETQFNLIAHDWYGENGPLTYRFVYRYEGDLQWKTLSEQSSQKNVSTSLPLGNIQLSVFVYDTFNSFTQSKTISVQVLQKAEISTETLSKLESQASLSAPILSTLSTIISNHTNTQVKEKVVQIISNYFTKQLDQLNSNNMTSNQLSSSVSAISSVSASISHLDTNTKAVVLDYFAETLEKASSNNFQLVNDDFQVCLSSISMMEDQIGGRRIVQKYSKVIKIYKLLSDMKSRSLLEDGSPNKISGKIFKSYSKYVKSFSLLQDVLHDQIRINMRPLPIPSCIVGVKMYTNELLNSDFKFSKIVEFTIQNANTIQFIDLVSTNILAQLIFPNTISRVVNSVSTNCKYQISTGDFVDDYCSLESSNDGTVSMNISRTGIFIIGYQELPETIDPFEPSQPTKPESSSENLSPMIIGLSVGLPIFAFIVACIIIVILVFYLLKRNQDMKSKLEKNSDNFLDGQYLEKLENVKSKLDIEMNEIQANTNVKVEEPSTIDIDCIDFEPLEQGPLLIPQEELSILCKLGSGGFGTVYKSEYRPKRGKEKKFVAVKSINDEDSLMGSSAGTSNSSGTISSEALLMCSLDHPNIVKCFGVSIKESVQLIVMEYVEGGSLQELINELKTGISFMDINEKIDILIQISKGINYLHGLPKPIVHRDLKPANCLLNRSNMTCKLCDFGLSKAYSGNTMNSMTNNIGTLYYMANELISGTARKEHAKSIDIYSFSILMWELIFEDNPYCYKNVEKLFYENTFEDSGYEGLNGFNVLPRVMNGLRPVIPFNQDNCQRWVEKFLYTQFTTKTVVKCLLLLQELLKDCWNSNPQQRPSFDVIINRLGSAKKVLEFNLSAFVV